MVKCKPMLCLQDRLHGAKVHHCGACTTRKRQPNDDRGSVSGRLNLERSQNLAPPSQPPSSMPITLGVPAAGGRMALWRREEGVAVPREH